MGREVDEKQERERNGVLELEKLKGMVNAWQENYSRMAEETGGGDFLCGDFQEEIEKLVLPYLRRLLETEHVSNSQVQEFMEYCSRQVADLCDQVKEEEA